MNIVSGVKNCSLYIKLNGLGGRGTAFCKSKDKNQTCSTGGTE